MPTILHPLTPFPVLPRIPSTVRCAQDKCFPVTAAAHRSDRESSYITLFPCPNNNYTADYAVPQLRTVPDLCPPPMHGCPLRVAYEGLPGSYSMAAAEKAYPGCDAVPCDRFEVAFQAVQLWAVDRAVLPIENSLNGSIHRNYDLLLRHRLHIVGEVQLPIRLCLLALPGVELDQITRVVSHPQALAECEHTLANSIGLSPHTSRESFTNSAGAAEFVSRHGLCDTAVIASAEAGALYGLNILVEGVQDEENNQTRFVIVARDAIEPRTDRPFKTSIVFACDDEGISVLFKVLSAFAFRDISLMKIESRPRRSTGIPAVAGRLATKRFDYMFYIDFEASMAEVRAQNALAEIAEFTSFLRILGSYPMDTTSSPSPSSSPVL